VAKRIAGAVLFMLAASAAVIMLTVFFRKPQKIPADIFVADVWLALFACIATLAFTLLLPSPGARMLVRAWLVLVVVVIVLNVVWFGVAHAPAYSGP
jgi:tryptophan-rich sensory protein